MMESGCIDMGDERICNFLLSTQHDEKAAIYRNKTKDLFEKGWHSFSEKKINLTYSFLLGKLYQ